MNRLFSILESAYHAVKAYKIRTFFCLLSISLGISSITLIVASVEGAYQKAYEIIDMFGPDAAMVFGGSLSKRAVGGREKTLTLADVQAVTDAFPQAYLVVPIDVKGGMPVSFRQNKHKTLVAGSSADYSVTATWPVIEGRDLSTEDIKGHRNVCLLGQTVIRKLFPEANPVGKFITVEKIVCQVVGVLSERSASRVGHDLNDRIIMPITTVMKKLRNERQYISAMRLRFTNTQYLTQWIAELKTFLRYRHNLRKDEEEDFHIMSSNEIISFLVALTGSLVLFLGISGIVSLIVSGFVLANLFLLSVSQRINEIGIRRAVGAKKSDIFIQFVLEATLITMGGGILGYLIGFVVSKILVSIAEFPMSFSYRGFLTGLVLAICVGIIFGVQPARKAANLSPIEAIK
ncbi:MAG: ABC transporter permease [Candidatus Magnetoovum sp. WYHC-5]|nr:ABC transporter permease [Candidatus Magnetoovum sp. WYHC-5]